PDSRGPRIQLAQKWLDRAQTVGDVRGEDQIRRLDIGISPVDGDDLDVLHPRLLDTSLQLVTHPCGRLDRDHLANPPCQRDRESAATGADIDDASIVIDEPGQRGDHWW